jgi:ATP-dependent exoDNAse (exonuclease V) beta subunit
MSHRVLKQIDKLKHLAEKKRLLYVALTRAKHDVVISALLSQKKDTSISLREDSYLNMICNALDIDIDELYGQNERYCIVLDDDDNIDTINQSVIYIKHSLKHIDFKTKEQISATKENNTISSTTNEIASTLGIQTHKIIELYWDKFRDNSEAILNKLGIFDKVSRDEVIKNMDNFYKSDIYKLLQNGVEHKFELEFNVDDKHGFIDFIYFDTTNQGWVIVDFKTGKQSKEKEIKYQEQLDFYENIMSDLGYNIMESRLLWLS